MLESTLPMTHEAFEKVHKKIEILDKAQRLIDNL